MIHAEHAVEFALSRTVEDGVGRKRSGEIAILRQLGNGRSNDRLLLRAEPSFFAGVRVESGHGDAGRAPKALLQKSVQ